MKKETIYEELDGLSPLLGQLKQSPDGMKIPEGYFDTLEDKVFAQLDATGERIIERPANSNRLRVSFMQPRVLLAAASFLVLLVAGWWILRPEPVEDKALQAAVNTELTPEQAHAYIQENIQEYDSEMLLAALEPQGPEATSAMPAAPAKPTVTKAKRLTNDEIVAVLEEMSDEELEDLF